MLFTSKDIIMKTSSSKTGVIIKMEYLINEKEDKILEVKNLVFLRIKI